MFLKNKNIIFKIRRSKVTDYAALIYCLVNYSILKAEGGLDSQFCDLVASCVEECVGYIFSDFLKPDSITDFIDSLNYQFSIS